jgi:hypothetical protein
MNPSKSYARISRSWSLTDDFLIFNQGLKDLFCLKGVVMTEQALIKIFHLVFCQNWDLGLSVVVLRFVGFTSGYPEWAYELRAQLLDLFELIELKEYLVI